MAGGSLSIGGFNAGSFVVNMGATYLLNRLTAQDGPRLDNKAASGGDYGVPIPRLYGEKFRLTGAFLAQADILEHEHTVEDYSEIVGAITGAAQGFMIGGPIGAVVGAIAGFAFGAATPDQKYYTYTNTFAILLADRSDQDPIEGVEKIFAAGKLIFKSSEAAVVSQTLDANGNLVERKYRKNRYFDSLTIYGGGMDQSLDPILDDVIGEESAFRPWAYAVIENLILEPWGNSVPAAECLTVVKTGETIASAAESIAAAANIETTTDLSTTAVANDTLRGYGILTESTCWDGLKPLLGPFRFDVAEVAGQLRFYKRSQFMRATILPDDMGAHIYGDSPPEKFRFRRATDIDLPLETALTFVDPARDYQPNTMTSRRSEGNAASNIAVSVPLVLSADEGASAAAVMHWDAWLGRTELSFTLTDAWNGIEPGIAYAILAADQYVPFRVTRKLRGANGIHEIEAVSDEAITYEASEAGESGTIPDEESTLFADTRLILMDMPITADDHDDYGFYVAMGGSEPYWQRGRIQASSDGVNFVTLIDSTSSAVMGDVTGTLAAGTTDGLDDTLDTTSVLTVVLLHDSMILQSATDAELDSWANFAFVGKDGLGEYLQWKTATKIATSTWELTNLRRGRKGTDHAIATHASGEEFVKLGGQGVYRINYTDDSQWGVPLTFRGVTLHQDPADADTQTFTNTGEGKRPYSPVDVQGTWDGSNNLTITWDYRSRLNSGALGVDDRDEYEVEILSGAGRVIVASAVESATYSAADQTSDGITPGDSIQGRVRQTSDVNDGRWRNFLLIGPDDSWELEDDLTPYHLEDGSTPLELEQ